MLLLQIILSSFFGISSVETQDKDVDVVGMSLRSCDHHSEGVEFTDGIPIFHPGETHEIYIYFASPTPNLQLGFTSDKHCHDVSSVDVIMEKDSNGHVALLSFTTSNPKNGWFSQTRYYICTKMAGGDWRLQDNSDIGFYVYDSMFGIEVLIIIILLCYAISSLMSGLNIGLLGLDPKELDLLKNAGTAREKKYAKKILPVRRNGNYLLCSILITATLCNAVSTVFISSFVPPFIAVPLTTTAIVVLCEILPQSICTTYPLSVGANTIYVTIACMIFTAPIAYPLGKLLDWLLGKESLLVTYNKERLQELLKLTQLATHEARIITGILNLSHKTVEEIMTMSGDIFKLPITAVVDFETVAKILDSGYSRIPIYIKKSSNIRYILLTKDLALLDPDDKVPVKVLVGSSKLKCHYISRGTTVDKLFEIFKDSRNHMVFVVVDSDSNNDDANVIGLVTFEDVIEEILQMEINDETDNYFDNRSKRKLNSENDTTSILRKPSKAEHPSGNLKLAIFNFLSGIDVFSPTLISPKVLRGLLNLDIYYSAPGEKLPQDTIYVQGKPANFFVMILEGEMELKIGSGDLSFAAGAFRYFGLESLKLEDTSSPFIPDYMLQAVKSTTYIRIDKVMYDAAVLATQYEYSNKSPNISVNSDLYSYYQKLID